MITAMSLVTHSIREPGEYSSGTPLMDNRSWRKNAARFKQLDALARRIADLPRPRTDMTDATVQLPVDVTPHPDSCCRTATRSCWSTACSSWSRTSACSRYKNVTINEPFFQGHFPGHPVMPGVLVIEALAQAGGLLTQLSHRRRLPTASCSTWSRSTTPASRKMVVPGDRLDLEVTLKRTIRNMAMYVGIARVDGKQVASAEILCAEVKADA